MRLSNQAIGSIMMALQRAILNQEDVTELLRGFDLVVDEDREVVVTNPPTVPAEAENEDDN